MMKNFIEISKKYELMEEDFTEKLPNLQHCLRELNLLDE